MHVTGLTRKSSQRNLYFLGICLFLQYENPTPNKRRKTEIMMNQWIAWSIDNQNKRCFCSFCFFSLLAPFSRHLSPAPLSSSMLSAFFHFSFLFHVMGVFPAYLPVHCVHALYLWRPEEGTEPRVTDCREP